MINLPINEIKKTDIEELVINKTAETKTLEYKEDLPKGTDGQIKEFLADVSSFANAAGGDIIYGIKEERDGENRKTGKPEAVVGIENISGDEVILRFENIIRDGLSPRLKVQIKCIDGFPKGPVIILRIPQSFSAPHMICKGDSRFYSRNSAGKYSLDVGEIRSVFLASETLPEKIKRFREQRLAEITADQTPVQLLLKRRFVLHVIPVSAFLHGGNKPEIVFSTDAKIRVSHAVSESNFRNNIDGYIGVSREINGKYGSYFQIFRSGIIEYVNCYLVTSQEVPDHIPSVAYEERIIEKLTKYLELMKYLDIEIPILIMISLLAVKGVKMGIDQLTEFFSYYSGGCIDRDSIILPDILLEDYAVKTETVLKTAFDAIWQACGFDRSLNYDEQGNWRSYRGR
jgi:Divergent AAA domain.